MIIGIGIDSIEIERVEQALRNPAFAQRLFTAAELGLPLPSIAARFAAREAVVKALGGLGRFGDSAPSLQEFEVVRTPLGAPHFRLGSRASAALASIGVTKLHLSLTHDRAYASAFVVAEGAAPQSQGPLREVAQH